MTVAEFIDQLRQVNAFLMEPAEETELASVLCSEIPDDYKEFLRIANGLQVSGIRLLGTAPMPLAGGHLEPDIFMATQDAMESDLISKGLVLGRISSDLLITFNETTTEYELLDQSCGDVLYGFKSLIEVLELWKGWHRRLFESSNP